MSVEIIPASRNWANDKFVSVVGTKRKKAKFTGQFIFPQERQQKKAFPPKREHPENGRWTWRNKSNKLHTKIYIINLFFCNSLCQLPPFRKKLLEKRLYCEKKEHK